MNRTNDYKKTGSGTSRPRTWKTEIRNTIAFYEKLLQRNSGKYTSINKETSARQATESKEKSAMSVRRQDVEEPKVSNGKFSVELTKEEMAALQEMLHELHPEEMREVVYTPPEFGFFDFDAEFDPEMLWEDTNLDEYREFLAEDVIEKLKSIQNNLKKEAQNSVVVSEEDYEDQEYVSEEDYEDREYVSEEDYEDSFVLLEDYDENGGISEDDFEDYSDVSEDDFEELTSGHYDAIQVSEEDYDDEIKISEDDYQE